jgi:uncharacterized protein (DUF1778 family)
MGRFKEASSNCSCIQAAHLAVGRSCHFAPIPDHLPYNVRTSSVEPMVVTKPSDINHSQAETSAFNTKSAKTSRIELRTTAADRDLIDRAAEAAGTDRSSFVLDAVRLAAQRLLADRTAFVLNADAHQEWERINHGPARPLPGLARLLQRPSPFQQHPEPDPASPNPAP